MLGCVDCGDARMDSVMAHAQATGQGEALMGQFGAFAAELEAEMARITPRPLAETLIEVNTGMSSSAAPYYTLHAYDVGEDQPAAELQA